MESISFKLARKFLGKTVKIKIDRSIGSVHPKFNKIKYTTNYGHMEGILAPDGDNLDAYLLKFDEPVDKFMGTVVAIVHRINNDDDKLVVIPQGQSISDKEIEKAIEFQEKWFKHVIIRE